MGKKYEIILQYPRKKCAFHPRCRMKLTVTSSNFTTLIVVKKKYN